MRKKQGQQTTKKLFWHIRGHDSFEDIFDITVALGQFSDEQMKHLLRALTARAGLDYAKIVGAYAKRKTKIANNLLDVHREFRYPTFMCGHGPVFTASVVDEHGKITRHPT